MMPKIDNKLLDTEENKTVETTTKVKAEKVSVRLLRETSHEGKIYKEGDTITIDKSDLKYFTGLISDEVVSCENCK